MAKKVAIIENSFLLFFLRGCIIEHGCIHIFFSDFSRQMRPRRRRLQSSSPAITGASVQSRSSSKMASMMRSSWVSRTRLGSCWSSSTSTRASSRGSCEGPYSRTDSQVWMEIKIYWSNMKGGLKFWNSQFSELSKYWFKINICREEEFSAVIVWLIQHLNWW